MTYKEIKIPRKNGWRYLPSKIFLAYLLLTTKDYEAMARKDIKDELVVFALHHYRQLDWETRPGMFPEFLAKLTGQPEKVAYRALERAMERGLTTYGVSLRTSFLDTKGEELYKELTTRKEK